MEETEDTWLANHTNNLFAAKNQEIARELEITEKLSA